MKTFVKTLFFLFAVTLFVGGWALAASAVHVVRTPGGVFSVLPKAELSCEDTYVDTRHWTAHDLARHPGLVQRLRDIGREDLLAHLADANARQAFHLTVPAVAIDDAGGCTPEKVAACGANPAACPFKATNQPTTKPVQAEGQVVQVGK